MKTREWRIFMGKDASIFRNKIFECEKCQNNKNKIKFMNPYMDFNNKINYEKTENYLNQRKFIMDYIIENTTVEIMIIGLAPGLEYFVQDVDEAVCIRTGEQSEQAI